MCRYYFHIRDGRFLVPDEEGMEFATLMAAQAEARASRRDMANAASGSGRVPASIEVEDEDGNLIAQPLTIAWVH